MSRSFGRKRPTRDIGRKLLIICEGEATEIGYFEAIRVSLRLSKERLIVVHPNATDPRSLVCAARDRTAQYRRKQAWGKGDQAWAVFDGDEHRQKDPNNWNDAIQLAGHQDQRPEVRLAISNPCFELWYLLHYQDQNAEIHRKTARAALRKHYADYDKPDLLWPDPLKPLLGHACNRAAILTTRAGQDGRDPYPNPYTSVHLLIAEIMKLKSPRG